MDIVFNKYSKCEASTSVIADILSNNDLLKYEVILNEFKLLDLHKIKDLATILPEVASKMALDGDPLVQLYEAMQVFDRQCDEQLKMAKLEYLQGNYEKTQEICLKLLLNQQDLHVLVLMAASCYKCKEYEKSMKYYQEAHDLYPDCAEVLNGLGIIHNKNSELEKANEFFFEAIIKNNDCMTAWINYANGLALTEENKEKAKEIYTKILNYSPELYVVRNNYGKLFLSLKEIEKAKEQFKLSMIHSKTYPEIWNNLGSVYSLINKPEKAIFHFETALKLNPSYIDALINLGQLNLKLRCYEKAINVYEKALQLCPENITALKKLACIYYKQDNKPLAIETYKKCLEFEPNNPNLHWKLAIMTFDDKKETIKHLKKCIEINPQDRKPYQYLEMAYRLQGNIESAFEVMMSLGEMYSNQNDQKNAIHAYTCALKLNPKNAVGYWKIGIAAFKLNRLSLALSRYHIANLLKPTIPHVYNDMALIFHQQGALERAADYYEMALIIQPDHKNALYNLTIVKEKLGCLDDLVELYKRLINVDPSDASTHLDLANILYLSFGNPNEALIYYKNALEIDNTLLEAYLYMGNIYRDLNKNEEALKCFSSALQIDPQNKVIQTNIGSIYKDCDNFSEAIEAYETVLNIDNDFPDAYCNLVQCLKQICNWSNYESHIQKLKAIVYEQLDDDSVPSLQPYHSLLYSFLPEELKKIASKYAGQFIEKPYVERKLSKDCYNYTTKLSNGRIRVGYTYVSSHFGHHPITQLMQSIPKLHNRNTIEVFCYSLSPNDSSSSWSTISTEFDNFRDISSLNDIDAANQINNDGIHILVNINCYTKGSRNEIFALRPAPIQVLWLGYPGTSGAPFIDYFITDEICSPSEHKCFYTEKLAYMNRTVLIGDHKQIFDNLSPRLTNIPRHFNKRKDSTVLINNGNINIEENISNKFVSINITMPTMCSIKILPDSSLVCYTRQMYNLPEDVIVYCNFGQLYKIDPSTFSLWVDILKNVPNSVLWILQFPIDGKDNLYKYATEQNINSSRIIFGGLKSKDEHIRRIQLADVFLDTPLCNAYTSCLDALWAGTPVITLLGNTFATRVAASVLNTLGCTDTIATSRYEYIEIATQLGLNQDLLERIRSKIWTLRTDSRLFDCKSYTEELENIYNEMWNNYLSDKQQID